MKPTTLQELRDAVATSKTLAVRGLGTKAAFSLVDRAETVLETTALSGIIDFAPDDQLVEVWAGTSLEELQAETGKAGLCLPLLDPQKWGVGPAGFPGTVGGLVAMNMPHGLSNQCGGPRDWILGANLVQADGQLIKAGCRAVKNVAGYDIPKLMVGSRGSLAVIASVILRLWPIKAVPAPAIEAHGEPRDPNWIQRTLRKDFPALKAAAGEGLVWADRASATVWAKVDERETLPRFKEDWVLDCKAPHGHMVGHGLKQALDPENKLNPGVFIWT